MNTTFDYLTSNRKWLIRDFTVWGNSASYDAAIIATEDAATDRLVFMRELLGGQPQIVEFTDLTDHRGNKLPGTLTNAEIIVVPKGETMAFVVGQVGGASFRLAKAGISSPDAVVDLIIMEMN
jgi:hypothetical protein